MSAAHLGAAPFESWAFCAQSALFSAMAMTLVVFTLAMRSNATAMRAGGTGIIGLQRAGSADKAHAILTAWGVDGRRSARRDLWLDLGLIVGYAVGLSVAFSSAVSGIADAAGQWWALAARLFAWLPLLAGVVDIAENGFLAVILARYDEGNPKSLDGWPRGASVLSRIKFFLLALALGWVALVLWPLLVP
ncbi:hypothetical protein A5662_02680 [Mycobacteriaceae bacterium 1482268.1]|nr:hypothetical protein A5662_02680 [Mycobacteriaceae bacterium 1482268.1]